ncbi:MAG: acetyl-CoA carboxylase carboxyltransferase subunit beta [Coriobacteriia bacterium]|nr:acetyl-CoA carboxylase carboxyltransferase subunit beta [Coriobacteriia bacterium]
MSIADWLSARENKRYTRVAESRPAAGGAEVPDGVWVKCESCNKIIYEGELADNARVCPGCGFHFDLTAPQRIELIADDGLFAEMDADLVPCDPLEFVALKPYEAQVASASEKSGLNEAIMTGRAHIDGREVVLVAMDFRFIGASMGSVVGEKVVRAFEFATRERIPVVCFAASGGARMQEGMLSLMQMAKTSAAVRRHAEAGLLYISILTNPTYGGVTASFAVLADVLLAEPGALIGFSGQRVIEQTIRQKLPKGFQTAEFMLEHGMIDDVVPRGELKARISLLLGYLDSAEPSAAGTKGGVL